MKAGPYRAPRRNVADVPPVTGVLLIVGLLLLAWLVVTVVMVGAIAVAGPLGPPAVALASAAAWLGIK